MGDFCPIRRIDHLELYVGNARQAAAFYTNAFGCKTSAYRGLETGFRDAASYLVEQGDIRLVLTTALSSQHPIARQVFEHGDGVTVVALNVPDAAAAFLETPRRAAAGAIDPTEERDESGVLRYSAIHSYGDTLIKFVDRDDYAGAFAPGFQARTITPVRDSPVGLTSIDHVVGNVELGGMERWVQFF